MNMTLGWHFLPNDRLLRWGDDKRIMGTWDVAHVEPPLRLCRHGLHWSECIIDAAKYAPGNICCRVESWGETIHDWDKAVSEYRRMVWWIDAGRALWAWVCDTAEQACADHGVTDERSLAAIRLRREWLAGRKVTYEEWNAAYAAAYAAYAYAAYAYAAYAACAAAYTAAYAAAAYAAVHTTQNETLEAAIRAEAKRMQIADWER